MTPSHAKETGEMTEKEKMLAGEMYRPLDKGLIEERFKAHVLCQELNNLPADDASGRTEKMHELFGRCGDNVWIEPNFQCDFGYNIRLGRNFFANFNCVMLDTNTITIGDDTMFGPNVTLCTATHPVEAAKRNNPEGREYALPITIGSQVWIGAGAIINPGVTIGDRAVVASGSVVTRDVPDDCLVAGVPAVIKKTINNGTS